MHNWQICYLPSLLLRSLTIVYNNKVLPVFHCLFFRDSDICNSYWNTVNSYLTLILKCVARLI